MQKLPLGIKIVIAVLLIIIVILTISLFVNTAGNRSLLPRSPLSPTTVPVITSLQVVQILPSNRSNQVLFPIQEFTIVFNTPVDAASVKYEVSPEVKTRIRQGDTASSVIIAPQTVWTPGKTTITIRSGTTAVNNLTLKAPRSVTFTSDFPENPVEEKEGPGGYPPPEVIEHMKQQYLNQ